MRRTSATGELTGMPIRRATSMSAVPMVRTWWARAMVSPLSEISTGMMVSSRKRFGALRNTRSSMWMWITQ